MLESPLNRSLTAHHVSTARLVLLLGVTSVLAFIYLALFDGGPRGATPGKRIVGTRVVDAETSGPIGYRRAAIRRVVYIVGGLAVYLGWLWLLLDPRRQAWHDKAASTIVIKGR